MKTGWIAVGRCELPDVVPDAPVTGKFPGNGRHVSGGVHAVFSDCKLVWILLGADHRAFQAECGHGSAPALLRVQRYDIFPIKQKAVFKS